MPQSHHEKINKLKPYIKYYQFSLSEKMTMSYTSRFEHNFRHNQSNQISLQLLL